MQLLQFPSAQHKPTVCTLLTLVTFSVIRESLTHTCSRCLLTLFKWHFLLACCDIFVITWLKYQLLRLVSETEVAIERFPVSCHSSVLIQRRRHLKTATLQCININPHEPGGLCDSDGRARRRSFITVVNWSNNTGSISNKQLIQVASSEKWHQCRSAKSRSSSGGHLTDYIPSHINLYTRNKHVRCKQTNGKINMDTGAWELVNDRSALN